MKKTLAIIGAGQLGSRHLQSLALLDKELFEIFVFDTQQSSLEVARQRYSDVSKENSPAISVSDNFNDIPKSLYAVIVATGSVVRRKVVENLIQQSEIEFLILEKFLFTTLEDYAVIGALLEEKKIKTYVNTPRRTFDFYRAIASVLTFPCQVEVAGSQWGLGCNAIHFLDLFYYLNQSTAIEVISNMDKEIIPSKREGYIEFTGSFIVKDEKNNTCQITSFKEGNLPVIITITDSKGKWTIHEGAGELIYFGAENGKYSYQKETIKLPFQSESTSKIIMDILATGDCKITPYKDSSYLHKELLTKYLEQYSAFLNQKVDSCPIT